MKDKTKVKEGCEESDRRERVEKVMELLQDVHYKTESEKDAAILSFTKANLTIDEIDMLVNPLRAGYKNDQTSKVGVY